MQRHHIIQTGDQNDENPQKNFLNFFQNMQVHNFTQTGDAELAAELRQKCVYEGGVGYHHHDNHDHNHHHYHH